MKLTNTKIKKLIRESLQRILFESEDRIADLKDQFNLVYQKMSRAKSKEEFDQLNAEAERLDKEINRLTRTMFKEPEEPGEFDFMQSDPIEYPVPYQSGEMTPYEDDIDPLDRPAILDVDEVDMYPGGPMTQREKNRRDFIRNFGVGIGASALLGRQIFDAYKDTAYEDFMMMSEAQRIKFVRSFVDSELQNMPGAIEYATKNSGAAESTIDELISKLAQHLLKIKNVESNPLYEDLYEILEDPVGDYIDELVAKSKDPRLQIASDWFDRSFTDGTWQKMYDYNFKTWTDNALINVDKDFNSMSRDEQLEYVLTYFMDYNPEGWSEALVKEFEMLGHRDPGETGEMDVYNQLDELIKQKIKDHYTPEKIKQLRGR